MAIMDLIPSGATPARRTRLLAEEMGKALASFQNGSLQGADLMLYQKLSNMQCWDAALYCAWSAKGVSCADVNMTSSMFTVTTATNYTRLFGNNVLGSTRKVTSLAELMLMPEGCFVGFISNTGVLRHAMLHTSNGHGAGNKSDCIFSDAHTIGWENLDMAHFFGKDKSLNQNATTTMVYAPVTGQTI
ncbi:MAG: hypothetical protein H7A01_14855 [Hahellaceae bacterium]|jgi:hypothetical protein|nr:hypothetical protein [Hahellaceae bacterium]MCP5210336.1 hypothetical protein [Hahellaceae bacterium]